METITKIVLIILCSSLFACHSAKQSPSGYQYIHHVQNDTLIPQAGDKVYYYADMRLANQILYTNRTSNKASEMIMRDLSQVRQASPIEECLSLMAIGDSLTVNIRVDTLYCEPGILERIEYLSYDIKLVDVKTKLDWEGKQTASTSTTSVN